MAHELETKILNVDKEGIIKMMQKLHAKKLQATKLEVYWYRQKGVEDVPWYLRIRKYTNGTIEVTWKGKSTILGSSRTHKEINFSIPSFEAMDDLFQELGLENYAFQEKYRTSWQLKGWRFDLDEYPHIPPYLEIEGTSEAHIQEAITLLHLKQHETSSEGEKKMIENTYHVDWHSMRF